MSASRVFLFKQLKVSKEKCSLVLVTKNSPRTFKHSKVVSTHLWNTPLNLYQQAMKGFLSWLTRRFAWGVLYGCVVIFLQKTSYRSNRGVSSTQCIKTWSVMPCESNHGRHGGLDGGFVVENQWENDVNIWGIMCLEGF